MSDIDEPTFVFRAQDRLALGILNEYYRRCINAGCDNPQLDRIQAAIRKFEQFRQDYPERLKVSD